MLRRIRAWWRRFWFNRRDDKEGPAPVLARTIVDEYAADRAEAAEVTEARTRIDELARSRAVAGELVELCEQDHEDASPKKTDEESD